MTPDMEVILREYLLTSEAVEQSIGDRVGTETPQTLDEPWIRINLIDSPPAGSSSVDHNVSFFVDLHCYAGRKGSADDLALLAAQVRSWLGEMHLHEHEGAVVSGAKPTGSRPLRDVDLDPAMDRWIVHVTIWAHPGREEVGS